MKNKKLSRPGWLCPAGKFYEIPLVYGGWGHIQWAHEFLKKKYSLTNAEKYLEDEGWCKLTEYRGMKWFHLPKGDKEITQPQIDFIFDWCVENEYDFPPDCLYDLKNEV